MVKAAVLASINPEKNMKGFQEDLESNKYQLDLGFKLGDPKNNTIENVTIVHRKMVELSERAGYVDYVHSLHLKFCVSDDQHKKAKKVIAEIGRSWMRKRHT